MLIFKVHALEARDLGSTQQRQNRRQCIQSERAPYSLNSLADLVFENDNANGRRIRGDRGKRLLRQRGEKLERWNAHLYDRGGMRRVHLRGRTNILKRLVVHAGAANLGLLMRKLFGAGTPKGLQG